MKLSFQLVLFTGCDKTHISTKSWEDLALQHMFTILRYIFIKKQPDNEQLNKTSFLQL